MRNFIELINVIIHWFCSSQVLETDFGLKVFWNGIFDFEVIIPGTYFDQVCGLCGSYDGDPTNDFIKPDDVLMVCQFICFLKSQL